MPDELMTITKEIRKAVEASKQQMTASPFSWPDDGCASEPWYYDFHTEWVTAWNVSGRAQDALTFLRAFLEKKEAQL